MPSPTDPTPDRPGTDPHGHRPDTAGGGHLPADGRVRAPGPFDEHIGERDLASWRSTPGRVLARGATRLGARSPHAVTLLVTAILGGLLCLLLTQVSAEVYESVKEGDALASIDRPTLDLMLRRRSPGLDQWITWFTDLGGPVLAPAIAAVVMAFLAWRWRSWTPVVLMVIAGAGSLAMTIAGKDLVGRLRPPLADAVPPYEYSPSFPSGHTLNAVVIAGTLAYLLLAHEHTRVSRTLTVVAAVVYALAMGLSRVFLGHHWLSDVVMGWALGLAWLTALITAHRLWLTVKRDKATNVGA